jgi:hypothetical protein
MTEKEFNDLVWNYGASGDKVFSETLSDDIKSGIVNAWAEIEPMLENSDINDDDTSKEGSVISSYYKECFKE